jgi:glycosyltransferase involved in cell wall biosynthesis
MKILHILNSGSWGGAEKMVSRLLHLFNEEELAVLCLKGELTSYFEERGIIVFQVDKLNILSIINSCRIFKPNIVHAHDFRATIFVQFCCHNVRIISHIHQNPEWLYKYRIMVVIYDYIFSRNTEYVTVSEGVKLNVERRQVIPNFVEDLTMRDCAEGKRYLLGYFGRLESEKNPLLFIDLVNECRQRVPHVKAVICGKGSYETEIKRRIEYLNLSRFIDFRGYVENVNEYYCDTKFVVNTSPREGFGLSSVEAASIGVPTFYVQNSGLNQILGDIQRDFEYSSINEFLEKLRLVSSDEVYIEKSRGLKTFVKKFNAAQAYQNWAGLYRE